MTYNHPSMFFHREVYKKHKYNTDFKVFSDYELVLKLYLENSRQFHYIPKAYVNYRLEGISTQQSFWDYTSEGAKARMSAGLSPFHAMAHVVLRSIFFVVRPILKSIKK